MNGIKTNEKIIIGRTDLAKDEYEKYQGKQLPDFGNEEFEIKIFLLPKILLAIKQQLYFKNNPEIITQLI
ncbi:MAG: hypothetical protein ACLU5J_03140 [Christensenellales bacterium]